LIDLAQIWYIVYLHDTQLSTRLHGQRVEGQGYRSNVKVTWSKVRVMAWR